MNGVSIMYNINQQKVRMLKGKLEIGETWATF